MRRAIAGGPYLCAEGSVSIAQSRCLDATPFAPDAEYLWRRTLALAAFGHIDPVAHLGRIRAFVFHGGRDERVRRPVAESLVAYWRLTGLPPASLAVRIDDLPAGHGFVVLDGPVPCALSAPPFINDCDRDLPGEMLAHLLALPAPPAPGGQPPAGTLRRFDQAEFLPAPRRHGMDEQGFVYVPPACATAGSACRVHVVFHGCRQGRSMIEPEDLVPRASGYLAHADALRLVLLFPQAAPLAIRNPLGCWDFFAYDDPSYYTQRGRQMRAVRRMLDRLRG